VAGRRMAQPVCPQLRKWPVPSGIYASCHEETDAEIFKYQPLVEACLIFTPVLQAFAHDKW
jgi:hypothetical protein